MRQLLIRILIAVACLVGIVALIGTMLPRQYDISTSIDIDAPVGTVFDQVNDLRNWSSWSSWSPNRIPDLELELGAQTVGEGASQRWTEVRGDGKLWITASVPNQRIEYELEFGAFAAQQSRFVFNERDGQTRVTWSSAGELPSGPFYGYFSFLFEAGMVTEFEGNLQRLKTRCEKSKVTAD